MILKIKMKIEALYLSESKSVANTHRKRCKIKGQKVKNKGNIWRFSKLLQKLFDSFLHKIVSFKNKSTMERYLLFMI